MKPKQSPHKDKQMDLFRAELKNIIDPGHGLVKLSKAVNWERMDELFGATYCPDFGRPGISTRLMVSLTGIAVMAAPCSAAASTDSLIIRRLTKGRTPS